MKIKIKTLDNFHFVMLVTFLVGLVGSYLWFTKECNAWACKENTSPKVIEVNGYPECRCLP